MSHLALITTIDRKGRVRHLYDAYYGYAVNDEDTVPAAPGSAFDTVTHRELSSFALDGARQGGGKRAMDYYGGGSHDRRADWTRAMQAMAQGRPEDDFFPIQICEHIIVDQRNGRAVTPKQPRNAQGEMDGDLSDAEHAVWTDRWMTEAGFKGTDAEHTRMLCMEEGGPRKAEWMRAWQLAEYRKLAGNLERYLHETDPLQMAA